MILISTVTGYVSISAFASFVGIPIGIASSTVVLKICIITAGIKKYKSIIKKKKKKHDENLSLVKSKLNSVEVLISKDLIDSNISHDEFVSKKQWQIKVQTIYKTMLSYCLKYKKNTKSKNPKVVRTKNGRIMLLSKCSVCNSGK